MLVLVTEAEIGGVTIQCALELVPGIEDVFISFPRLKINCLVSIATIATSPSLCAVQPKHTAPIIYQVSQQGLLYIVVILSLYSLCNTCYLLNNQCPIKIRVNLTNICNMLYFFSIEAIFSLSISSIFCFKSGRSRHLLKRRRTELG